MRRCLLLVLFACSAPPKKAPAPTPAAVLPDAASRTAEVDVQAEIDRCAADAKAIQPIFDRNLALYRAWGDAVEIAPSHAHLVRANDGLEKVPARISAMVLTPGPHLEWIGPRPAPRDPVVLAIDADTPWVDVVGTAHTLGFDPRTVYVAFAVETVHVEHNPLAGATIDQMRALGADLHDRCPAAAELFMPHGDDTTEQMLASIARGAQGALGSCACKVTPRELAQAYDVMLVRDYVAVRSITIDRKGLALTAKRTATFAQLAPKIMAAAPGTAFAFTAD